MAKRVIFAVLVIIAFASLYAAVIMFEPDIFPGNTKINGESYSYKKTEYIVNNLNDTIQYHDIKILNGNEELATLNTKDCLNIEYKTEKIDEFLNDISITERLFFFLYQFEYNIEPEISIVDKKFDDVMKNVDNGDMPENAYIKYDNKQEQFVIVPHTNGNQIDKESAISMIKEAALTDSSLVDISGSFVKAGILEDNEELNEKLNKLNEEFSFSIKYTVGKGLTKSFIELNGKELHDLYECDEFGIPYISSNGKYEVDEKAAKKFLDSINVSEDTIETARAGNEETEDNESETGMSTKVAINKDEELEWLCNALVELKNTNRTIK